MFDVNPQSYKIYFQDVERQFAAATMGQTAKRSADLSRPRAIIRRFAEQGLQGAAVVLSICVVVVFIL